MKLLYSDILPLGLDEGQDTINNTLHRYFAEADQVEIAVGYVSKASLEELEMLTEKYSIKKICLNIGMYFIEGMPESSFHTLTKIEKSWQEKGIGEVRLIKAFKYHGKSYCFLKDGKPIAAVMGSANLGVLKLEANNRRQYEIASLITDAHECAELYKHIEKLKNPVISSNLFAISKQIPIIREMNTSLTGIDLVTKVPEADVNFYRRCNAYVSFVLPLKVPSYKDRLTDDGKHYTKSNVNVCYAAPRNKRKSRDWYETQLTVAKDITRIEGYPEKNVPFFVITDDGYRFKAHTTSDGNKQFSAVGDELIMGRWLKGRLAAAGLITPVNDTQLDHNRDGMVTNEILKEYGCRSLEFKKTGRQEPDESDESGKKLDVWMLSFIPGDSEDK